MVINFRPPFGACLQQGGDDGVDITAQRVAAAVMLTPLPFGIVTAGSADLIGQLHTR